jgi:PAS domain S-box-containing protein
MPTSVKVLILEDRPSDAELTLHELRRAGYEPVWKRVETEADYLAQLDQGWEIILADYNLPQFSGLQALDLLKARRLDIPFIIISGTIGEDMAIAAIRSGAKDYLMKDNLARLGPAVTRELHEAATRREHKKAEEALLGSEAEFRAMFEMASIGMAQADPHTGRWVRVNQKMCAITGYSADELLQMRIAELTHPEDRQKDAEAFQRVVRGEVPDYRIEKRCLRKDGKESWVNVNMTVIRGTAGQPVRTMATIEDITERKQTEAYHDMDGEIMWILNQPGEVRDSVLRVLAMVKARTGFDAVGIRLQEGEDFPYLVQEGFSKDFLLTENTLVERGADGGVCRDREGKVRLECTCGLVISGKTDPANPLFTKRGSFWTNDSSPLLNLSADQDPRRHPRNVCFHHGYGSMALIPIRTKDRIIGLLQLNARRKGCFTFAAIEQFENIATHVGEALTRKQAEGERKKLQEQLNQAQRLESIGQLAGGVAHDFNNLLMVIGGYSTLLLKNLPEKHTGHNMVGEIQKATERGSGLTRQLLSFGRKQIVQARRLHLGEIIRETEKLMRQMLGENIRVILDCAPDLVPVVADPGQIHQVLMNLMINARDAMPRGGAIHVTTSNVKMPSAASVDFTGVPGENCAMLTVRDEGTGMTPEVRSRIFEPFFTTKGQGMGTGLGLAVIYGIVKQSRGDITVHSEVGKGTTFRILLPEAPKTAVPSKEATQLDKKPVGGTETILLVEDDEALRKLTTMILRSAGYRVIHASEAQEALRTAGDSRENIHLMLSDVVMPGMNGLDLADNARLLRPELKVILMSGYSDHHIMSEVLTRGNLTFVSKPISDDQLLRKVREVLDGGA